MGPSKSFPFIWGSIPRNHDYGRKGTLQGMDTYPTKREVRKIIDSKCHAFGGIWHRSLEGISLPISSTSKGSCYISRTDVEASQESSFVDVVDVPCQPEGSQILGEQERRGSHGYPETKSCITCLCVHKLLRSKRLVVEMNFVFAMWFPNVAMFLSLHIRSTVMLFKVSHLSKCEMSPKTKGLGCWGSCSWWWGIGG